VRGTALGQSLGDQTEHPIDIGVNIDVPEAKNLKAKPFEFSCSSPIRFEALIGVMPSINLHDQSCFRAEKVDHIPPARNLPPKLVTHKAPVP
jgi:hypothetical protein